MERTNQKRRFKALSLVHITIISLTFIACKSENSTGEKQNTQKPNIIYILADDLGYGDLSFTGQKHFSTPNIDQLAKSGMFFTQHYSGSTVCAPSRSSIFTGLHTGHTFVRGNKSMEPEGQYPLDDEIVTMAEHLKSAKYVTGAFGKWGLGPPSSEGDPTNQGFDEFFGYNCQSLAHNYYPDHLWKNKIKVNLPGNEGNKNETYAANLIHDNALEFIDNHKDTSFFMFYPSVIPHAELAAPEEYMEMFRGKLEEGEPYKGVDEGERYKKGPYGSQEETHVAFAAMVTLLDHQVGEIVKKLNDLGIADNTLIIFTSDNGPHKEGGADPDFFDSNREFKGYKRDLYEGGIRVPMIAAWPGKITPNSTSDHISAFWDVMPTLCEVAGAKVPEKIDGISFLPELTNNKQAEHEHLYWEFHEQGGKQAVRMGDWKGIRLNVNKDPSGPIELYDLSKDVGEENNIASAHPEIVAQMDKIMGTEHVPSEIFMFGYEKVE